MAGATEDYLRLRHRAKEAHAVSAEEQRQCDEARRKVTRTESKQASYAMIGQLSLENLRWWVFF